METQLSEKAVAPYGTWTSPITADLVARGGTSLSGAWLAEGAAWFLEGRPYEGAELLGLELDEHIANVIAAMQPIAGELGLRTAADAA